MLRNWLQRCSGKLAWCEKTDESALEAEPMSPCAGARIESAETLPGTIAGSPGGDPLEATAVESRLHAVSQSEMPGRLWDPSDPPAQACSTPTATSKARRRAAHPAWQMKRDKEESGGLGNKSRFPARLPPLSGLSSKSLRLLKSGSTPVLEVSNLPEPELSPGHTE